jgi:hypothetical protein
MGVQIEFIGVDVLDGLSKEQRMDFILDHVKSDRILVIEEGMSAEEESELIAATMAQINKKFPGIEVSTLKEKTTEGIREKLIRMLGGSTGGLTVIGPSKLVKQISKDPRRITMLAGEEEKNQKKTKK